MKPDSPFREPPGMQTTEDFDRSMTAAAGPDKIHRKRHRRDTPGDTDEDSHANYHTAHIPRPREPVLKQN